MADEIAHAMKSCFAGLYLDGFDFIQGLVLGFHLNEVKISSLPCNDFIKLTKKRFLFVKKHDLADALAKVKKLVSRLRLSNREGSEDGGLDLARLDLGINVTNDSAEYLCLDLGCARS